MKANNSGTNKIVNIKPNIKSFFMFNNFIPIPVKIYF